MNRERIIAIAVTALLTVVIILWLTMSYLRFDTSLLPHPPRPVTEIVEAEEEYVDFLDMSYGPSDPSPAYNPEPVHKASQAAEASGPDLKDAGPEAAPVPDVVRERPAEVKRPKREIPPKQGPDKKQTEEEKARRKARKGVSDAFKNTSETPDNTSDKGKDKGDSGTPDGSRSDANGRGVGTVGGGWIMPSYAVVPSTMTGSIILSATINSEGRVVSVQLIGGKSPAAANRALVQACMAEVRNRKFTRNDDNAPESATARITYTFI